LEVERAFELLLEFFLVVFFAAAQRLGCDGVGGGRDWPG